MNKAITILISIIAVSALVISIVAIKNIQFGQRFGGGDNVFPTSLNVWVADDTISSAWANELENKIGADSSTVSASLDYQTRNANSKLGSIYNTATTSDYILVADGSKWNATSSLIIDNNGYVGIGTTTPFSQFSITGNSRMSGNLTVTATITGNLTGNVTGNADTATTLVADPADCSGTNLFAKGIGANGSSTCAFVVITSSDIPLTSKYMLVGNASNVASSTSAMIIDTNGYIGVATTTPTKGFSVGVESYFSATTTLRNALVAGGSAGTSGQFLKTQGAGTNPIWAASTGGISTGWQIKSSTTTEYAATNITFSGLNLVADGAYKILFQPIGSAGINEAIPLFVNADTTITNYYRDITGAGGTSNDPYVGTNIAAVMALIEITMSQLSGYNPRAIDNVLDNTGAGLVMTTIGWEHISTTNVTSITFNAITAAGFATGTKAILFELVD